jgi:iron complex outermembrane receptor protein
MFYYGYEDYQVFIVENSLGNFPQLQIINANNAEVYGLEAALRMEPVDGLVVNGRFAWLESVFLDFTNESVVQTDGGIGPDGISISSQLSKVADFSGNRLINSPQFTASFSVAYTISLGRFGQLIPLYDASWSDDIFFDASEGEGQPNFLNQTELPENAIGQRAFWLHNLRLSYRLPDGRMEISTWVRNVTDQVYKTYSFDASTFSKVTLHFPGMPRTYGGSISFSW